MHSVRSEPYYYESIYYFEHKHSVFVVDSCGRSCQDIEVHNGSTDKVWKCSSKCKPLTECEVNTILDFESDFDRPMCELLPILLACDDDCPNTHCLPTWTWTVIVHVYHVHIVCGYGMLTSSNESETITNFFYIRVYIYSHN